MGSLKDVDVVNTSCALNHAVMVGWLWSEWQIKSDTTFSPVKVIAEYHHFAFRKVSPGEIFARITPDGKETRIRTPKPNVTVEPALPDVIPAAGRRLEY